MRRKGQKNEPTSTEALCGSPVLSWFLQAELWVAAINPPGNANTALCSSTSHPAQLTSRLATHCCKDKALRRELSLPDTPCVISEDGKTLLERRRTRFCFGPVRKAVPKPLQRKPQAKWQRQELLKSSAFSLPVPFMPDHIL